MFKVTGNLLANHVVMMSLNTLHAMKFDDNNIAYRVHKIVKRVNVIKGQNQQDRMKIIAKFAKRNEDKSYVLMEKDGVEQPNTFVPQEGKEEECKKALEAVGEAEYEINSYKFRLEELAGNKLSGTDLAGLEPFMVDLEAVEE